MIFLLYSTKGPDRGNFAGAITVITVQHVIFQPSLENSGLPRVAHYNLFVPTFLAWKTKTSVKLSLLFISGYNTYLSNWVPLHLTITKSKCKP